MIRWVVAAAMVLATNSARRDNNNAAVVFTVYASDTGDNPLLTIPVNVGSNAQAYRWGLLLSQLGLFVVDPLIQCLDGKNKAPCHQLPDTGYLYLPLTLLTFSKQEKFNQGPFKGTWARDKFTIEDQVYHDFPLAVLKQIPDDFVPAFGLGPASTAGKNNYPGPLVLDNNTVLGNLKQRLVILRQMFSLSADDNLDTNGSALANWTLILGGVDLARAESSFVRLPLEVSGDVYLVLNGVDISDTPILARAYKLSLCYQCRSHWPLDAYSAVVAAVSRYTNLASDGLFACADIVNVTMKLDFGGVEMPMALSAVLATDDPHTCQVRLDSSLSAIALGLSVWRYLITVIDYETLIFAVAKTNFNRSSRRIGANIPSLIEGNVPLVKGFAPGSHRQSAGHTRLVPLFVLFGSWLLLVVLLVL